MQIQNYKFPILEIEDTVKIDAKTVVQFTFLDGFHSEHTMDDVLVYSHDQTTLLGLLHTKLFVKKWLSCSQWCRPLSIACSPMACWYVFLLKPGKLPKWTQTEKTGLRPPTDASTEAFSWIYEFIFETIISCLWFSCASLSPTYT